MSISQRMFELMEKKGFKKAEFARQINCTPQAINNWRDRGTTPPMEYLPAICKALDISWEYLVTGKETTTAPHLTVDEEHLLKNYRKASDKGRGRIQECAREMVQLYPYTNKHEIYAELHTATGIKRIPIPFETLDVVKDPFKARAKTKPNTEVAKKIDITHTEQ